MVIQNAYFRQKAQSYLMKYEFFQYYILLLCKCNVKVVLAGSHIEV